MKRIQIGICWISGTVLLILTTATLLFILPSYDQKVSLAQGRLIKLEYEREMRFRNYQWFFNCQVKEHLCEIEKFLVILLKRDDQIEKAESMMKNWRRKSISKLYTAFTNKLPSEEDKKKWNKMTMEELIDESDRIQKKGNFIGLFDDIRNQKVMIGKIEDQKIWLIVWTGIVQVIGLLLINISQYFKEYVPSERTKEPKGGNV